MNNWKERKMKFKISAQKIVMAALFASLVCVATMIIKIPSPLKGYINLGDSIVLTCGWLLSPAYSFLAAGLGSALADLFSGYAVYAVVTFVIKGAMALIAFATFKLLHKKNGDILPRVIGGVLAELFMILGYFVFEGFLYGFAPSAVNIPANGIQGVAGLILGIIIVKPFDKVRIGKDY